MAKKILFINQEIAPYVPDSEMSLLGRQVPQKIQEAGYEIRTFMPKWGTINERRGQLHEVIRLSGMNLIIDDTDHPLIIKVASIPTTRIQVYFIDNDDYFMKRLEACDENGDEYADNGERAIFYARGVLETVKKLRWVPDIIHCQGWISAVAPLYIKTSYREEPSFRDSRIIFTPAGDDLKLPLTQQFRTNLQFKGLSDKDLKDFPEDATMMDLYKLALRNSNGMLLTASNMNQELIDYANELGLPVFGPVDMTNPDASSQVVDYFDSVWSEGKAPIEDPDM